MCFMVSGPICTCNIHASRQYWNDGASHKFWCRMAHETLPSNTIIVWLRCAMCVNGVRIPDTTVRGGCSIVVHHFISSLPLLSALPLPCYEGAAEHGHLLPPHQWGPLPSWVLSASLPPPLTAGQPHVRVWQVDRGRKHCWLHSDKWHWQM